MLTVITPTGGRPAQFGFLVEYMLRQRYVKSLRWIIVDDVHPCTAYLHDIQPRLPKSWSVDILRPANVWRPGDNTQARNMDVALALVERHDRVIIMEDDDWYSPLYLNTMDQWLDAAEMVGEGQARYYNVATRTYRQLINEQHASLCSTAFRGNAINILRSVVSRQEKWIDISAWNEAGGGIVHPNNGLCVGIKGLPGRDGIGMGHRSLDGQRDPDGSILRQWIGDDVKRYLHNQN